MPFDLKLKITIKKIILVWSVWCKFNIYRSSSFASRNLKYLRPADKHFRLSIDLKNYEIHFMGVHYFTVKEYPAKQDPTVLLENKAFGDVHVKLHERDSKYTDIYCNPAQKNQVVRKIGDHFIKRFGIETADQLFFPNNKFSAETIEWICNLNLTWTSVWACGGSENPTDPTYARLFDDGFLRCVTGLFVAEFPVPQNFMPTNFLRSPLNLSTFSLDHAHWITKEHLLCMNFPRVNLSKSKLTVKEISECFNNWKEGREFNWTQLNIIMADDRELDIEKIAEGISQPNQIAMIGRNKTVTFKCSNDKMIRITLNADKLRLKCEYLG
ncbi:hypothetical protein B9Z55_028263 [Caenorhabditis nigoni]|uniref:Sdz-33 F-box domain-containing protein n=1 Tax=Caenorhabditis nigoni TaxID=1611254 RepID=A0A2G5SCL4_9PELO|nr:hypothetical protein B9Z55_028263 [Caenorhabditis nigoni]